MLIIRGMTMVVITSWMGVDKCHPDQVRNSGFGSNYPSSLSDPSITSITPLLISSLFSPAVLHLLSKDEDVGSEIDANSSWEVLERFWQGWQSSRENFSLNSVSSTRRISHRLPTQPMHAWHLSLPLINCSKLPPSP